MGIGKSQVVEAPIMGIERHRMNVDGKGITTLVLFPGCPLHCKYCINDNCHIINNETISTVRLYNYAKQDALYYMATGGGICFGGGEPLLWSDFIYDFCKMIPPTWKITIETSLHVEFDYWKHIAALMDLFIIDIKTLDADIYHKYTGGSLNLVLSNLINLKQYVNTDKIIVRVPQIPSFTNKNDQEATINELRQLGFKNIDCFEYTLI